MKHKKIFKSLILSLVLTMSVSTMALANTSSVVAKISSTPRISSTPKLSLPKSGTTTKTTVPKSSTTKPSTSSGSGSTTTKSSTTGGSSTNSQTTSKPGTSNSYTKSTAQTKPKTSGYNINTNSKVFNNIPPSYSNHSVSNNYYYTQSRPSFFSNFLSHYFLFRLLTPHNRVYYTDGGMIQHAPAFTGFTSIIWDILTGIVVIFVIFKIMKFMRRRRQRL